jgi:hypothetical protein
MLRRRGDGHGDAGGAQRDRDPQYLGDRAQSACFVGELLELLVGDAG